jgi:hypothetical protein
MTRRGASPGTIFKGGDHMKTLLVILISAHIAHMPYFTNHPATRAHMPYFTNHPAKPVHLPYYKRG